MPELLDPVGRTDDVRQSNAEFLVHDDDLTLRDQRAVDQHVHRLASQAVKFDDRALIQL